MDFDLSSRQQDLLDRVMGVVEDLGGLDRARAISREGAYDEHLDRALRARVDLPAAGLLERVLVAERLAEVGTATTFGLQSVLGLAVPDGPVSITERSRNGPVRYASAHGRMVLLDGHRARVVALPGGAVSPVRSSYGFPYGRVERAQFDGDADGSDAGDGQRLRRLWRLATAAELAGNAATAVAETAAHLRTRQQFGRPLSHLQALRHRLAEAAVTAEATRWMVRAAAFTGDDRDIDLAAAYAADCAAALVPELVQLCGARSFTIGFGLQAFAMRLAGLRMELGGTDRLANAVLAHTVAAPQWTPETAVRPR